MKEEFFDGEGNPQWKSYIRHGDKDGFDLDNQEENGKYLLLTKKFCTFIL